MIADENTLITETRRRLSSFWSYALQIEWERDRLHLAWPLMLPDGLQLVFELRPITGAAAILSDAGRILGRLAAEGLNVDAGATADLIERRLAFFGLERDGFELRRPARLPIEAVEVQLFAEGLSSIAQLINRHEPEAEEESVARKSVERLFQLRHLEPRRNHALEGRLEKAIRVSYYLEGRKGLALEVVDRRTNLHGYMQQWGWRWTDLHARHPQLVRAMVYDPDRQEWDAAALEIGRSVCEVFCPYHESEELGRAVEMADGKQ